MDFKQDYSFFYYSLTAPLRSKFIHGWVNIYIKFNSMKAFFGLFLKSWIKTYNALFT